jgi:hypothetical protein
MVDDGVGTGIDGLDLAAIADRADASLASFLSDKARDGELGEFAELLRECGRAGGKRIRPVLCVLGWQAIGGEGDAGLVYRWAASLELFHLFALIHDDIMDDSATRRGRPTVHRMMAPQCHGIPSAGRNRGPVRSRGRTDAPAWRHGMTYPERFRNCVRRSRRNYAVSCYRCHQPGTLARPAADERVSALIFSRSRHARPVAGSAHGPDRGARCQLSVAFREAKIFSCDETRLNKDPAPPECASGHAPAIPSRRSGRREHARQHVVHEQGHRITEAGPTTDRRLRPGRPDTIAKTSLRGRRLPVVVPAGCGG